MVFTPPLRDDRLENIEHFVIPKVIRRGVNRRPKRLQRTIALSPIDTICGSSQFGRKIGLLLPVQKMDVSGGTARLEESCAHDARAC